MSAQFDVDTQALRTYAKNVGKEAERIRRIRNKIDQVSLAHGTFGKLPQSDELAADYDEQRGKSLEDLADAASALEDIADAVRDTARAYDRTENDVDVSFEGR